MITFTVQLKRQVS